MQQRLYDKAVDIAMLRVLMWDGYWHTHGSIVRDAIDILGWGRVKGDIQNGMHATLRAMEGHGVLQRRVWRDTVEYRLTPEINVKLITGGLDPRRMGVDEILELDLPNALPRRIQFEPDAYLRVRGDKRAAALRQCPSPWAYAERLAKVG